MSDTDKAKAVTLTYLAYRPGVRAKLTEQVNTGMRAQALEQTRSVAVISERDDEDGDRGPRITDTTGEAAIRSDPARRLLAELDSAERGLTSEAHRMFGHPIGTFADLAAAVGPLARFCPGQVRRSAAVFDRALGETLGRRRPDAGKAYDGLPGCQSCARLVVNRQPWWSDPNYASGNPTDLGGMLTEKVRLCRACQRFAVNQEPTRLPTVAELQHRRSDPRGQWPRRYAENRRAS